MARKTKQDMQNNIASKFVERLDNADNFSKRQMILQLLEYVDETFLIAVDFVYGMTPVHEYEKPVKLVTFVDVQKLAEKMYITYQLSDNGYWFTLDSTIGNSNIVHATFSNDAKGLHFAMETLMKIAGNLKIE